MPLNTAKEKELPDKITIHWSGGHYDFNWLTDEAYHFTINAAGEVKEGIWKPEDNDYIRDGNYAAHTGQYNTGNIGVCMLGMAGAVDSPAERFGKYPLKLNQYKKCIELCADLMEEYNIPIDQVFIHSAIRPMFGKGRAKWDVNVIPVESDFAKGLKRVTWEEALGWFRQQILIEQRKRMDETKEKDNPSDEEGSSSKYYSIPEGAKDLDDLITYKNMNWHIANIFKACYRFGEKPNVSELYDINKILWFAKRRKQLIEEGEWGKKIDSDPRG